MGRAGISRLQREVLCHYTAGKYREALDLVNRSREEYRAYAADICYWQACLASRLGEVETALQTLTEAAGAGFFYGEGALDDPDLDPLRPREEFQRLKAIFMERQEKARSSGVPRLFTWPPAAGEEPCPLVLALHGNGSRVELEASFWQPAVDRGWVLAMPQSSLPGATDRYVWTSLEQGTREVLACRQQVTGSFRIDPGRSIIGGFSRGAALAIHLALTGQVPVAGFLAVAPSFHGDELQALMAVPSLNPVRGYLVVGEQDPRPYRQVGELEGALRQRGIPCRVERHPQLGHDYPGSFAGTLAQALDFLTVS